MDHNLLAALVTSVGTTVVAITAILTNNKRFDSIEHCIDRVEHTLDVIQTDLKGFYKAVAKINA